MLFQTRENTWLTKQSNSIVLRFQSPQANFYEFQVNFTVRQRNIGNTQEESETLIVFGLRWKHVTTPRRNNKQDAGWISLRLFRNYY